MVNFKLLVNWLLKIGPVNGDVATDVMWPN